MGNTLMDVTGEEEISNPPINFRRSDTRRHLVSFDEGEGVADDDAFILGPASDDGGSNL